MRHWPLERDGSPGARGEDGRHGNRGKAVGVQFDRRLVGVSTTTYGEVLF